MHDPIYLKFKTQKNFCLCTDKNIIEKQRSADYKIQKSGLSMGKKAVVTVKRHTGLLGTANIISRSG